MLASMMGQSEQAQAAAQGGGLYEASIWRRKTFFNQP